MKIECVWEHNGEDSLLYFCNQIGAFTRGESKDIALKKMTHEIISYGSWLGKSVASPIEIVIVQEKISNLNI